MMTLYCLGLCEDSASQLQCWMSGVCIRWKAQKCSSTKAPAVVQTGFSTNVLQYTYPGIHGVVLLPVLRLGAHLCAAGLARNLRAQLQPRQHLLQPGHQPGHPRAQAWLRLQGGWSRCSRGRPPADGQECNCIQMRRLQLQVHFTWKCREK